MADAIDIKEAEELITQKLLPYIHKEIIAKYFRATNLVSESKGSGVDVVTAADKETERYLIEEFTRAFPQSEVLGEESAEASDFVEFAKKQNLWVIDPIDGTANFARGNTDFAISIALVHEGRTRLGIASLPVHEESYVALEDDENAYCNGKPISVSKISEIGRASIGSDFSYNIAERLETHEFLGKVLQHVRAAKVMGSGVGGLIKVAKGELDGYFAIGFKPWDGAAGSLILEKAGGRLATPEGVEWDMFQPRILATNGIIEKSLLLLLNSN